MSFQQGLLKFEQSLVGRRILVTGHTGFTGSWVCLWLKSIGAMVGGLALPPITEPSLFSTLSLDKDRSIASTIADICDYQAVARTIFDFQPDAILHLAAQPLVRRSYREPLSTFAVNVMGTAHVLEGACAVPSVRAVVCVTTDKVYKNNEWPWAYRENDPLGGKDPYSASKAAAEMVIESYKSSFGKTDGTGVAIAAARGGNIIGGGDWSEDRLIPDFVRAVIKGEKLTLRYPGATRPWQHVLALVQGYLMLIAGLLERPERYARSWNFGPHDMQSYSVKQVFEILSDFWAGPELEFMSNPLGEAQSLALDSTLARNILGWVPAWDTRQMIERTASWYRRYYEAPDKAFDISVEQLSVWRHVLAELEN